MLSLLKMGLKKNLTFCLFLEPKVRNYLQEQVHETQFIIYSVKQWIIEMFFSDLTCTYVSNTYFLSFLFS